MLAVHGACGPLVAYFVKTQKSLCVRCAIYTQLSTRDQRATMKAYKNPFRGQRKPQATGAAKQHESCKKKKDNGGQQGSKGRSNWGLLSAIGSFAAVCLFSIWQTQSDSKAQKLTNRRILNRLMLTPVTYTEHAMCRMKCR